MSHPYDTLSLTSYTKIQLGLDPSTVFLGGVVDEPVLCFVSGGPEPLNTTVAVEESERLGAKCVSRVDLFFKDERALDEFIATLNKIVRPEFPK